MSLLENPLLQLVDHNWNGETINVFLYRPQECFYKEEVMKEAHEGILRGHYAFEKTLQKIKAT